MVVYSRPALGRKQGIFLNKEPKTCFLSVSWYCRVTGKHKKTHLYYPEQFSVCKDPQGCLFKGQILGAILWRWDSSRSRLGPGSQLLSKHLGRVAGKWSILWAPPEKHFPEKGYVSDHHRTAGASCGSRTIGNLIILMRTICTKNSLWTCGLVGKWMKRLPW